MAVRADVTVVADILLTGFAVADNVIELTMPPEMLATALARAFRPLTVAFASAKKPLVVVATAVAVPMPRVPLAMFVELTPAVPPWAIARALIRFVALLTLMVAVASPLLPGVPVPNVLPPLPPCAVAVAKMIPPPGLVAVRLEMALAPFPPAAPLPSPPMPPRASCERVNVVGRGAAHKIGHARGSAVAAGAAGARGVDAAVAAVL